jgi:hypothetical protein
LIVRDSQSEDTPIRIFNPKTLQLDTEATEVIDKVWVESEEKKELTMKFDKDADKVTGRLLKESPFFTDGVHLFVVSLKKHIKPEEAEEDAPTLPTAIVVEMYCPNTWKHLKSTTLHKTDINDVFIGKKGTE